MCELRPAALTFFNTSAFRENISCKLADINEKKFAELHPGQPSEPAACGFSCTCCLS